jgi:hypothetical protein
VNERRRNDYYDVEPSYDDSDNYYNNDSYWEDSAKDAPQRTAGNEEVEYIAEDTLYWESCSTDAGTVQVLMPPSSVDRPTIVLHFVGGTFFGSSPSIWYRRLLEEIVENTQAVVVATSIPVTLWQSPLQHIRLSRQIERQFQTAWREVLLDEYGDELASVPVCGIGHSLGSRLLTVMATLGDGSPPDSTPERPTWKPPAYSSYILISFTNYGAGAGIPGIYQLNKASRRLDSRAQEERRQKPRRRSDRFYEEDDDYDDEDWQEILQDLQGVVQDQASRVRRALTPDSKELEFYPSPELLWKAVTFDQRYKIPETLLVQFDDDEIDQSAKLAAAVGQGSNVRFARLRGSHLTPVAIGDASKEKKAWYDINSRAGKALVKLVLGQRRKKSNAEASRELRQTITSYITEVGSRVGLAD